MAKKKNQKRFKRKKKQKQNRNLNKVTMGSKKSTVKRAPTNLGYTIKNRPSDSTITFTHREYIIDLTHDGTDEKFFGMEVNPGLDFAFPWAHKIAHNFESYIFISLQYEYIPMVGTNTNGIVALSPDYDATDINTGIDKQKLLSFEDSIRTPVWKKGVMRCNRQNLRKRKTYFVRADTLGDNLDKKLYDSLALHGVINGCSVEGTIGEIWVSYTIKFMTPQSEPESIVESKFALEDESGTYIAHDEPFDISSVGIGVKDVSDGMDGLLKFVDSNNLDVIKAGKFLVDIFGASNGTSVSTSTVPTFSSTFKGKNTVITPTIIQPMSGYGVYFNYRVWIEAPSNISADNPMRITWAGLDTTCYLDLIRLSVVKTDLDYSEGYSSSHTKTKQIKSKGRKLYTIYDLYNTKTKDYEGLLKVLLTLNPETVTVQTMKIVNKACEAIKDDDIPVLLRKSIYKQQAVLNDNV